MHPARSFDARPGLGRYSLPIGHSRHIQQIARPVAFDILGRSTDAPPPAASVGNGCCAGHLRPSRACETIVAPDGPARRRARVETTPRRSSHRGPLSRAQMRGIADTLYARIEAAYSKLSYRKLIWRKDRSPHTNPVCIFGERSLLAYFRFGCFPDCPSVTAQ